MEIGGLSPTLANGTNRLGVFANTLSGAFGFYRKGKLSLQVAKHYILIAIIGAIPGIILATQVSNSQFRNIFRILIFSMFILMLTKPKKWLIAESIPQKQNPWIIIPVFLLVGFYGGFIQLGMGVFVLAALVLHSKIELIEANAIKLAIVTVYTLVALGIFHWKGMIDFKYGMVLAIGQSIGSYFTATYAANKPAFKRVAFRLLVGIVFCIILRELYLVFLELN